MSDTTQPLDPKRPWLNDERELPAHMNWLHTLFDPTGTSPQLHFTRAWTALFMAQLMIILVPFVIALIINMAGGNGQPVGAFGLYATPVVFIVTTLMSYVVHSRRLNDANKPQLLAVIPLIPLIIAIVIFMGTAQQEAASYDERFEMRQEYLADPDAFRAKQREEQQKAREEAEQKAAEAQADGEEGAEAPQQQQAGQGRGGPGGPGGMTRNLDEPMPPKAQAVLKGALPMIQFVIIPLSGLIAIWSLVWVARAPLHLPTYIYKNDSYRFAFTSWHGRLSRKRFALGNLFLFLISLGVQIVFGIAAAVVGNMAVMIVPAALMSLVLWYFSLALTVKRIHDLGYDVLDILKIVVPIAIVLFIATMVVFFATGGNLPEWFILVVAIPAVAGAAAGVIFGLWLWFGEPEWRDNKHGEAPEVIPADVSPAAV